MVIWYFINFCRFKLFIFTPIILAQYNKMYFLKQKFRES